MSIILEITFTVISEFGLGMVGEMRAELGLNFLANRTGGRIIRALLYTVSAVLLGILSLFVVPKQSFGSPAIAALYFTLSPIAAGLALCGVNWIIHRGIDQVRFFQLTKFVYGVIFVLTFSLTRALLG